MSNKISENNKRIAKNTLLLYIRMLLTMVITLYTSRVIISTLGVIDFGIYNVIGGVITALSFFTAAMAGATQRFLSYAIGQNDVMALKDIFAGCLKLHLLIALLFVLLSETVGLWFINTMLVIPQEKIYAANWIYQFTIISFIITIICVPYNATIIAHEKMSAFAYISILEVTLKLLIAYLLVYVNYDKLIIYGLLLTLVTILLQVVYSIYCAKHFIEARFSIRCTNEVIKKIGKYIGWSLYSNLSGIVYGQGINFLLNIFFGPTVNAARAIAYQVQGAVQRFITSFQMAVNPQIVKLYAQKDFVAMYKLMIQSSRLSFYLMFIMTLPIYVYINEILTIWLKDVPTYTGIFCRLILIISLVDTVSNPLTTATQATGQLKLNALLGGTNLLLIIPTSILFLKMGYSPQSVFYINIIFSLTGLIIRLYINKRLISFPIKDFIYNVFLKNWCIALIASILPFTLSYIFKHDIYTIIYVSITSLISSVLIIYLIGLERNEKKFINKNIQVAISKLIKRNV